jgi:O-antigen ligase
VSGVSVVQLADGTRWLRAYGSLPHPNLLGGFVLALLTAPITFFLSPSKRKILPVVLFIAGLVLLLLAFSRSAWVGFAVGGAVLLFHLRRLDRKRLSLLALAGLLTVVLVVIPLRPLFFTRFGEGQVQTEQVSNDTRLWLIERTVELIQKHPVLGVGIGSYSLALSRHVEAFYTIEPVHNVLLLALSELGIAGVIVLGGLAVVVVMATLKARNLAAIVLSAALMGLFVITLFDHYLWTLAPGRLLLISMLGLWAGQVRWDEYQA